MDIRMDDLRTPALALATAVGGGLIVLLGQHLTSSREYDAKMVEIAMGVLRTAPSEDLKGVRVWATSMINRHSGVRLNEEAKRALENKELPPYRPFISESYR